MDYSGLGGIPFLDDKYHAIELIYDAGTGSIRILVDTVEVFSAADTTCTAPGRAGIGAYNDAPYSDYVAVVPEPAALAIIVAGAVAMIRRR